MTDLTSLSEFPEELQKLMKKSLNDWLGFPDNIPSNLSLECTNPKCRCKERLKRNEGLKRKEMGKDDK
jgi:hypothetical protein